MALSTLFSVAENRHYHEEHERFTFRLSGRGIPFRIFCIQMVPEEEGEEITGRADIIALFKSSRRGIIIGCKVRQGSLNVRSAFLEERSVCLEDREKTKK
jgi:hypothetical protein